MRCLEGLHDPEAAEVAVYNLIGYQPHFPAVAEIREAYETTRKQWEAEQRQQQIEAPTLPPVFARLPRAPEQAWSPEGARWAMGQRDGLTEDGVAELEDEAHRHYLSLGSDSKSRAHEIKLLAQKAIAAAAAGSRRGTRGKVDA